MTTHNGIKLADLITIDSKKTIKEVNSLYRKYYSSGSCRKIEKTRKLIVNLFNGKFKNYKACNTEYHDLEHTEEAFLAVSRLLYGYNCINGNAVLDENKAECLLIAALFHDTGYIQEQWEKIGTGAKYTLCHVDRSIEFLRKHYNDFRIDKNNVELIASFIKVTDLAIEPSNVKFDSPDDRKAGYMLATADIIGQMSNRRYLEKLMFLYNEFVEAAIPGYESEYDLLKKTVGFYEIIKKRLTTKLDESYLFMNYYFKNIHDVERNLYIEAIDRNIDYIVKIINDSSTNFRSKLKRADWIVDFKPVESA
ncbi:MAG: hypothetical protein JW982_06480 [Spirochaetes bacterium]|nr:hypothetical protein [Spirochaetota bacterium]